MCVYIYIQINPNHLKILKISILPIITQPAPRFPTQKVPQENGAFALVLAKFFKASRCRAAMVA